jgi:hypothetical protein
LSPNAVPPLLREIDAARKRLRSTLAGMPDAGVALRQSSDKWSALEILKHLLFAEQAHMGRLFREQPEWSPLGFTPETMRAARKLPPIRADEPTVSQLWTEWDRIHRQTTRRLKTMSVAETEVALSRHLKHLEAHIAAIEKLIRQGSR